MNATEMQVEAAAKQTAAALNATTQLGRAMAAHKAAPAVIDWMLERGYVAVRKASRTAGRSFAGELPYLTDAGRAWLAA